MLDAPGERWNTPGVSSEDHVATVRRGFTAALAGDLQTLEQLLHPDVVWHGGDPRSGCVGRKQVLAFMRSAVTHERGRLRQGRPRLVDVIDAGDRVVVLIAPDGDPDAELRANITTFRDGLVVEMLAQESPEAAFAAVGADAIRR